METVKKVLLAPFRAAGFLVRITGRIVAGAAGFVMMGGGLFLTDPLHLPAVGIPLFVIGLLLTLRAVF